MELDGSLATFDRRFLNGQQEGYGADLSSPALGSDRIPLLADADARVGRIIGNAGYRINLGGLTTDAQGSVGTGFIGLALGLTSHIAIFGRIPLVQTRVQSSQQLDPATADAGISPSIDRAGSVLQRDGCVSLHSQRQDLGRRLRRQSLPESVSPEYPRRCHRPAG